MSIRLPMFDSMFADLAPMEHNVNGAGVGLNGFQRGRMKQRPLCNTDDATSGLLPSSKLVRSVCLVCEVPVLVYLVASDVLVADLTVPHCTT